MDRREKIRFMNAEICPKVDFRVQIDFKECIRLIERWRIGKPIDVKMNPFVDDGFLYMNGEPLGRIAAKMQILNHLSHRNSSDRTTQVFNTRHKPPHEMKDIGNALVQTTWLLGICRVMCLME